MPTVTYKNAVLSGVGTTLTQLCAADSGEIRIINSIVLVNTTAGAINVNVTLTDTSASVTAQVADAPIAIVAGKRATVNGPFVLEALDALKLQSDTATSLDAYAGQQIITP